MENIRYSLRSVQDLLNSRKMIVMRKNDLLHFKQIINNIPSKDSKLSQEHSDSINKANNHFDITQQKYEEEIQSIDAELLDIVELLATNGYCQKINSNH